MGNKNILLHLIICILSVSVAKSQTLQLKINGKNKQETTVIDSIGYLKKHQSLKALTKEVDSIFQLLQKLGYVQAQLLPLRKKNDSLYLSQIFLENKFQYLKIYTEKFPLSVKFLKNVTLKATPEFFVINFRQTEKVLSLLNNEIANKGRPFSYLQLVDIENSNKDTLVAKLAFNTSNYRTINKIVVKGYEKFPVSFLKHYLGIEKGAPFNKTKLEKKMKALQNLVFAKSIKPPEVQFTKDSTTIYLYLRKEPSNSFDGFLGFSNDSEKNNLQLTGQVDFLLQNNLNFGESLHIEYKSDGEKQMGFEAKLNLPYLFQTPIGLSLGLQLFKKDSTYLTVSQQVKINYIITPKLDTYLGYEKMESTNLLEENFAGNLIEDYTTDFVTLGFNYTDYSKFSGFFPIKTNYGIDIGIGKRNLSGKRTNQFRGAVYGKQIFQLNNRNSIYLQNKSAFLTGKNSLSNELFRLGGVNSIRGFAENSIFASLFSVTQTEYRYLLSSNLYVHSVIDYAFYENKALEQKENLYGIGFGLGLRSKAGILRIIFANGKADGQKFEFSNSKIHLSLVAKF